MADALTILIVDDSMEDRETYKRFLTTYGGLRFLECETGDEALEMIGQEKPGCILLDYNLPDTDGLEILTQLSGNGEPEVPVILLTGQGNENIAVQAMKAGAMDYLIKTDIHPELLSRTVRYAIEKKADHLKLGAYVRELEQANRKIVEQQKAVIEEERLKVILQMAGATAHEFNQPLMILLNGIELMKLNRDDPEKMAENMELVSGAGQRISDIVKKIQTMRHYETQPYAGGKKILRLDQSLKLLVVLKTDRDFEEVRGVLNQVEPEAGIIRARDLDQGKKRVNEEKPDLVLMDYFMPSGTALDFIRYLSLRKIEVPVVVVSGSGDELVASRTIQAGAYDYLPKARITVRAVKEVIENTLSRFRIRQETALAMVQMTQMATRDGLTSLFNRKYFDDGLAGEIERSLRYQTHFSLFLADMDHFKRVNDTYGHSAGDKVLKHAARCLERSLRKSDVPCRFGGEEFAAILPNTRDGGCREICERFRRELESHGVGWDDQQIFVTVSIGVASFSWRSPVDTATLVDKADRALYEAKRRGRNRVC